MPNTHAWSESLSVGTHHIDEQHRQLIALGNRAAACACSNSPGAHGEFHAVLNELATLMAMHFNEEEKLLKRSNSPTLSTHAAEHNKYQQLITDLLFDATIGRPDRAGLHRLANDQLIPHIFTMDVADKAYLQM